MRYLLEFKKYYDVDDIVLIEYWYNGMITPVKIVQKNKKSYKISHNIKESKIHNAPDEVIKSGDIIDFFRT